VKIAIGCWYTRQASSDISRKISQKLLIQKASQNSPTENHDVFVGELFFFQYMGMGQNPIPPVNIKIAGIYGCSSPKNGSPGG
jgi:hypothetical protein